jgi:Ni,Fe-hydrogenase III small subunit/formate hydrogenlyase subunit 6/NADH:ubiquinone oxidoreductase subunit I
MFDILLKSLATGIATTSYPETPAEVSALARGCPDIEFDKVKDPDALVRSCATGAIFRDNDRPGHLGFDLGKCTFCGICAEQEPTVRITNRTELAVRNRAELIHHGARALKLPAKCTSKALEETGEELRTKVNKVLGRSLHIREVDAGSCNGCELEISGLTSPVYDVERFGIHFVASPRHADMLLVTGPVARNMELALRKTYAATPEPRLVVAVGACGCSGGIFGVNYATRGAVDAVVPVDAYIPGCPPNPHALLHGILLALGRL